MLLRRVTYHLRQQDWLAVMLDLLVVIIGILLAIQFNGWVEDRDRRAMEQQYLEALYADFTHNIAEAEGLANMHREFSEHNLELAKYIVSGQYRPEYQQTLANKRVGTRVYPAAKFQLVTFDEIVSTGRLEIITDRNLRRAIQNFAAETEQVAKQLEHFRRSVIFALAGYEEVATDYSLDDTGNIVSTRHLHKHFGDNQQINRFYGSAGTHGIFARYRSTEKEAAQLVLELLNCALEKPECQPKD